MEQDRQFRYIALELCLANVQDYVQGRYQGPAISRLEVLRQATAGLRHLHRLNIGQLCGLLKVSQIPAGRCQKV